MYDPVREMTVNLTGEFSKDFVPRQNGRFPAGQQSLYFHMSNRDSAKSGIAQYSDFRVLAARLSVILYVIVCILV